MRAAEFGKLINRFYITATDVLIKGDALVDRLVGDEVVGLFIPGMAGPQRARRAVKAAEACSNLQATTILAVPGYL